VSGRFGGAPGVDGARPLAAQEPGAGCNAPAYLARSFGLWVSTGLPGRPPEPEQRKILMGDMDMKNVEWVESRFGTAIRVFASEKAEGWSFWEKEVGEERWFSVESTPILIARAAEEFRTMTALVALRRAAAQYDEPETELMPLPFAA
jgi:hypothetical protein